MIGTSQNQPITSQPDSSNHGTVPWCSCSTFLATAVATKVTNVDKSRVKTIKTIYLLTPVCYSTVAIAISV